MLSITRIVIGLILAASVATSAPAEDLGLAFKNPDWTGKSVPSSGICTLHGGKGQSPAIQVTGLPIGAARLVVAFTDRDWGSEGAHGVIGVRVPSGANTATIPALEGEVDTLPATIEKISIHECRACAGGIYLGPCSGGGGHQYYVTVRAERADGTLLAEGTLVLGNY